MKYICFTVPGNPIPKQSGKMGIVKGNKRIRMMYTKPEVKAWEKKVSGYALESRGPAINAFKRPQMVSVTLTFYRGTKHEADGDNLTKGTIDGMKGILFQDDVLGKDIAEKHIIWGGYDKEHPRVEITVKEMPCTK